MTRTSESSTGLGILSHLALVLVIALVIARATIEENTRDRDIVTPESSLVPRAPSATTGLIFDLLLCMPAIVLLTKKALSDDKPFQSNLSHVFFGAIALLAALSTFWSSDKFGAAVNSAHLIAAAALLWSMTQLVRTWLDTRLVAAACFGLLLIYLAKGALYHFVDLPSNIMYFEDHKLEQLRERGLDPGSFQAEQFERKLRSGELLGFSKSPNTFAAMVVLLGIVSAGAAVQRLSNRDEWGWAATIVIALTASAGLIVFTQSKAAFVSPFLAAALLLATPWMRAHRRQSYFAGLAIFAIGSLLLVLHGLYHGSLVVDSMTFRWRYWIGAARVFASHPILGVGWSDFGAYYVGVRLPNASEEIKDPHNFIVRIFVELGVVGGILVLVWLARLWWEIATPQNPIDQQASNSPWRPVILLCLGSMLSSIAASTDLVSNYEGKAWFVLLELMNRALFGVLFLFGCVMILRRAATDASPDDRAAPWIGRAMIVGAGIFLIHNLIDFSLFEPGPMCIFAMILGTAMARGAENGIVSRRRATTGFAALSAVLWIAGALGIVAPTAIAETIAWDADQAMRGGHIADAAAGYRNAFERLWIPNADYAFRAAIALLRAGASPAEVRGMIDAAIAADPMQIRHYRFVAEFELRQPQPDMARIIGAFEKAISLDPNAAQQRVDFADALSRLGQTSRAADEYRAALKYNDLLDPPEPKRFSSQKIQEIEHKIAALPM